jgi:ComF family protein
MKIKEALASIVFPPRCPVCDEVIHVGKDTCDDCRKKVVCIGEPVCKKCGKPLENQRREYCSDCARKQHYFSQGKAVFVYQGEIRHSMYRFKYSNKREYAAYYAKEAARIYGGWIRRKQIEAIVPVPMYRWKEKGRGYNQAAVFAMALGERMNLPVEKRMVKRIRNTTPQKELNDVERKANLKKAFQLVPDIVKYKKILIVDDIYTTGSTIDAVAEVLLQAGVEEIYFLCISIGEGF